MSKRFTDPSCRPCCTSKAASSGRAFSGACSPSWWSVLTAYQHNICISLLFFPLKASEEDRSVGQPLLELSQRENLNQCGVGLGADTQGSVRVLCWERMIPALCGSWMLSWASAGESGVPAETSWPIFVQLPWQLINPLSGLRSVWFGPHYSDRISIKKLFCDVADSPSCYRVTADWNRNIKVDFNWSCKARSALIFSSFLSNRSDSMKMANGELFMNCSGSQGQREFFLFLHISSCRWHWGFAVCCTTCPEGS